ncbi:MAG: rhodanese-like domain-containing protein [Silicimonas sp.]|jgi:rhodanese-related sulfurtransferase|nr:rhodanese-like domain-containing protein [Silicimonas sp.]
MTSCASTITADPNATAKAIDVTEAKRLHGRAGVEFIDPRPAEAIASTTGRIPGARNVTLDRIEAGNLPPVFADTSLTIVTSCLAGPMARTAAEAFVKRGYSRVLYLDGGTRAWVEAGHPTV